LSDSGNQQCPEWPDYPLEVEGATGGLIGGKAIICGGGYPKTDKCHVLTDSESKFLTTMSTKRYGANSIIYDDYIFITGGYGDNYLNSTEKIKSDGTVIPGPQMPMPLRYHAMTTINKTYSMVFGGESSGISASKKTFWFNKLTSKWSDGPNLNIGRRLLAAGIVTDDVTNEEFVIVSGGDEGVGSINLKSTEILMDNKWSLV